MPVFRFTAEAARSPIIAHAPPRADILGSGEAVKGVEQQQLLPIAVRVLERLDLGLHPPPVHDVLVGLGEARDKVRLQLVQARLQVGEFVQLVGAEAGHGDSAVLPSRASDI